MSMDDELRRELLAALRHARNEREAEEAAQPIFSKGVIDWDYIAALVGFTAGGPLVSKILREKAKKAGHDGDVGGFLKDTLKKILF